MRTPTSPTDRGWARAGFTLLELLLVLALLAAAAMVVLPRVGGWRDGFAMRDGVGRLAGAMNLARVRAVWRGQPVTVHMAPDGRGVVVDGRLIALGPVVEVALVCPGCRETEEDGRVLSFYPDGSADLGGLEVVGRSSQASLIVDPISGRTRVAWSPVS